MNNDIKTAEKKPSRRYNPFYLILDAFKNLWRHRVISFAAVLVLTSCLILLGAFVILIRNLDVNIERLGLLNELVVFIDADATDEQVRVIGEDIKALDNVAAVEFISKDAGLDEMRDIYSDYSDLFDAIEASGDNPLSDSYVITYKDNALVNELEYQLTRIPGIKKVNNRLDYAVTVENFKNGTSFVFVWFFALLLSVSVFVIFNTVKLAVHTRRDEISIMRFIGATNLFIVTPFIIEGAVIGLLSSFVAYFADMGIYSYILSAVGTDSIITLVPFSEIGTMMLPAFLFIGVISGIAASLLSIRKNLSK
jgi:cell division transport system permease protein